MKSIEIKEIISFLGAKVQAICGIPDNTFVSKPAPPECVTQYTLDWVGINSDEGQVIAENSEAKALIVSPSVNYTQKMERVGKVLIIVKNPKLEIARVIEKFFLEKKKESIHPSATIHPLAKIGKGTFIGPNCYIGKCEIGEGCTLLGNNYIEDNSVIHNNVEIHAGAVIGNEAHNFIRDNNELHRFPHIGGVIVEDNVIIGANSTISRGVLGNTVIGKGTKIAQLVFIGANNSIGTNCAIRPNVMTSGSVKIGNGTIIAPSVTIREHRIIGSNSLVGMGAVVVKDVPENEVWVGNPAKALKNE